MLTALFDTKPATTFDSETPKQYVNSLIALGMEGGGFREYAAANLMHTIRLARHLDWGCCFWMMISALARGDVHRCQQNLIDWSCSQERPVANITRFRPGKHYHALGLRFPTITAAEAHIRDRGYRVGQCFDVEARPDGD